MGLTAVVETVIGLAFIYLLTSLFCSGLNEMLAHQMGRRGRFLREGLVNLVVDRWIYLRMINHPLVASLYRDVPGKPRTPSYVPSRNFAEALIDVVVQKGSQLAPALAAEAGQPRTLEDVRAAAISCRDHGYTTGATLLPLLDAAEGDLTRAREAVEAWFESGTQRISGWYKAYTRWLLLAIGIAVAVVFNVDSLQIATELSRSASLRRTLADAAADALEQGRFAGVEIVRKDGKVVDVKADDLNKLAQGLAKFEGAGLPIGFSCLSPYTLGSPDARQESVLRDCWRQAMNRPAGSWLAKMIGWLITGLAVCLGAPFWFDLLNKLVDLRGAGKKPAPPPAAPSIS